MLFLVVISYWQGYEYVNQSPNIIIYLENSKKVKEKYETKVSITNGSESILKDDIVRPISINFNQELDSLIPLKSIVDPEYKIKDKSILLNFELFNNDEEIELYIYTKSRPLISDIDYRIKNIESIQFYDYQNKSKFIQRIIIWIILLVIAILLFCDALIVISKDFGLGEIKSHIHEFPLTGKNSKEFTKGYLKIYGNYKLRFKPPVAFMHGILENTFRTFPCKSTKDIEFIKNMLDIKTEIFTFYRTRTAFVIISPLIVGISLLAIIINFFYYDLGRLNQLISINFMNKFIITLLFIITVIIIIYPKSIMNIVFLKKKSIYNF